MLVAVFICLNFDYITILAVFVFDKHNVMKYDVFISYSRKDKEVAACTAF